MVCIYCRSSTAVVNSRVQKRTNHIWRRRRCLDCGSIFTSLEQPSLHGTFMVTNPGGQAQPLNRDKLFVSIYHSCKHRTEALEDATALTQIVLSQLLAQTPNPLLQRNDITRLTHRALTRFDQTAAAIYAAYHPLPKE